MFVLLLLCELSCNPYAGACAGPIADEEQHNERCRDEDSGQGGTMEKEACPEETDGVEHAGAKYEAEQEQTPEGHVEDCQDEDEPKPPCNAMTW